MSDRFKFRVWAKSDMYPDGKIYYPLDADGWSDQNGDSYGFMLNFNGDVVVRRDKPEFMATLVWARIAHNDVTLMQSIGLRDKTRTKEFPKGKLIFEGDILQDDYGISYIYYRDSKYSPKIVQEYPDKGCWDLSYQRSLDLAEIIGNIHEHPDLLT